MTHRTTRYDTGDIDKIRFFIAHYPFAVLLPDWAPTCTAFLPLAEMPASQPGGLPTLYGHLDNHNPVLKALKSAATGRVIFTGPNAYISPRDYHSSQFPTWNYACVEMSARIHFIRGEQQKRAIMERQIAWLEGPDARLVDTGSAKYAAMLSAVTFFTLDVTSARGRFKFSQEKSLPDRRLAAKRLQEKCTRQLMASVSALADLQDDTLEVATG